MNATSTRPPGMIEKTLAEFGIPAKVIGFRVGPTVTQFAVEPGFMEKAATEEDASQAEGARGADRLACSATWRWRLSAERLRIEAPVPGQPLRGHRGAQRAHFHRAPAPDPGNRKLSTRSARRWRSPWGGMSPGSRWWPTWLACRTC